MDSLSDYRNATTADFAWRRSFGELKKRTLSRLPLTELAILARFLVVTLLVPAGLLLALLLAASWKIGTLQTPAALSKAQQDNPRLALLPGGGLTEYAAYKLARIKELQPDIVFIGQSRCGQIRSAMFKPYSLYNACFTSWTLDQIREFMERVAEVAKPSIVIFELDYFMFTKEYKAAWTAKATMDFAAAPLVLGLNLTLAFAKDRPRDLLNALKPSWTTQTEPHTGFQLSGLDSIPSGAGFRYDGSFLYPFAYRKTGADLLKDAARQFLSAVHGGPGLDSGQVEALSLLSGAASKLGVKLVGIELPVYAPVVDYLDTDPSYYPYAGLWRAFQSDETRQLMERLDITFFDTVRLPENNDAKNFMDPAHPSEMGILNGLLAAFSEPRFKAAFPLIEPERLRREYEDAQKSGRNYDVYTDHF